MSTRGDILRRAAQVEPDAVPEPWRSSDDEDALATVSDREHYRRNLVTLPDGAGEVPAYVWDFPRTPTIPDEVREEWTRGSAGRVLGPNGKYVSKGSDTPRKSFDGEDPGLLVEAASRTNTHTQSSRFYSAGTFWDSQGASYDSDKTSILDDTGATAALISAASAREYWEYSSDIGPAINGEATAYLIFEKGTSDKVAFEIEERNNFTSLGFAEYEWSTDTATASTGIGANARTLTTNGPNGNKVVEVRLRYDESSEDGAILYANIYPDRNGNSTDVIAHHFQREEAPNASSPIVTGGSPVTRSGDEYAIFEGGQPEWWNDNEGTFLVEFTHRFYEQPFGIQLLAQSPSERWVGLPPTPNKVNYFDGTNSSTLNNAVTPFTKSKTATSVKNNEVILSANGKSLTAPHNGALLSVNRMQFGVLGGLLATIHRLIYIPRALPESTLNRITS